MPAESGSNDRVSKRGVPDRPSRKPDVYPRWAKGGRGDAASVPPAMQAIVADILRGVPKQHRHPEGPPGGRFLPARAYAPKVVE